MKIKIGDFVRFVDEEGEGHVTAILEDDLIGVTGDDGFEIPVLATKVTLIHEDRNKREREAPEEEGERDTGGPFIAAGVYLAILEDAQQSKAELFLVNESSFDVLFGFKIQKKQQSTGVDRGVLAPKSSRKVYITNTKNIGAWPVFDIDLLFYSSQTHERREALSCKKRIRALDLTSNKKQIDLLNNKGWSFQLDLVQDPQDLEKLKEHFISHRPSKQR